jgi:hypothetical protein
MRSQGKPNVMAAEAGEREVFEGEFEELGGHGGGGSGALATVRHNGMQRVQTTYMTAVRCQVPREPEKVMVAVVREAKLAGEDFMYSFSIGKGAKRSLIEGVSIDGAMILSRNWGNCVPEIDIVEEGTSHWVLKATFIDLETGFTLPRLFRQRKTGVQGNFDADRKLDIALQIGTSKAQRNVIVKAMPTYLVQAAVDAAKQAAAAKIKDLPKAIADAVATFGKMTVTAEELETFIGVPRSQWNATDIVRLRATYRAITDRQTSVEQEFRSSEDEAPAVRTPDKAAAPTAQPVPPSEQNMFTGEPNAPTPDVVTPTTPASPAPPPGAPPAPPASPPEAPTPAPAPATPSPDPSKLDPAKSETKAAAKLRLQGETPKREREPGEEG